MKLVTRGLSVALLLALGVGCQSGTQEGVRSNYRKQWTDVYADVETTTAAAKQVFEENKFADVSAEMDKVKGEASATMADKSKIYASVVKTDKGSQITVLVGKLGDPKMGAEFAAKVKQIAEKKPM